MDITYISHGRVETPISRGGQFCCSFVTNLWYLCAKNYQNTMRFAKITAEMKGCNFFASQSISMKYNVKTKKKNAICLPHIYVYNYMKYKNNNNHTYDRWLHQITLLQTMSVSRSFPLTDPGSYQSLVGWHRPAPARDRHE